MPAALAVTDAIAAVTAFVQPWADRVADSPVLATSLITVHLVAIFAAGGLAIGVDRRVLRATSTYRVVTVPATDVQNDAPSESPSDMPRSLLGVVIGDLGDTHRPVIAALALAATTGVMLLLSDVGTFAVSRVFWSKMALLGLLLLNGLRLRKAEARLAGGSDDARAVRALRAAAFFSLFAWFGIVVLGAVLGNA